MPDRLAPAGQEGEELLARDCPPRPRYSGILGRSKLERKRGPRKGPDGEDFASRGGIGRGPSGQCAGHSSKFVEG